MQLLRAATLTVSDIDAACGRYARWLDYQLTEEGRVGDALAASWGAPATAGRRCAVMRPASGADVFLRFVEQPPVPGYLPLRSWGWAAIEICVTDVLKVAERMADSPFEIIGPPREIDGLPAIYPMQVKGPEGEIIYLTQIRDNLPSFDLPRAATLIDKLFILVLACSDMRASLDWFERAAGLSKGREMSIQYTMLAQSFALPVEQLHTIATMTHERDVFLELDQYPPMATARPRHEGMLPPGVAMLSLLAPRFDALASKAPRPAGRRDGAVYGGRRAVTLEAPDGALVELVEMSR